MVVLLTGYGMNVLGAIVTLITGFVVAGCLSSLTHRAMRKADKIDAVLHALPGKVVRVAANSTTSMPPWRSCAKLRPTPVKPEA